MNRYPEIKKVDGKILCRGCGKDVPKGRQTWCSNECYDTKCPARVIFAVRNRDKGICQICHIETVGKRDPLWRWLPNESFDNHFARIKELKARRPEYDHIIPFSEGGETIAENMRTLCYACHKKRTSEWQKQRAQKRAAMNLEKQAVLL
jgi:hypothetical protein